MIIKRIVWGATAIITGALIFGTLAVSINQLGAFGTVTLLAVTVAVRCQRFRMPALITAGICTVLLIGPEGNINRLTIALSYGFALYVIILLFAISIVELMGKRLSYALRCDSH